MPNEARASLTMRTRVFLVLIATLSVVLGLVATGPGANATEPSGIAFEMPDGTLANTSDFTEADFQAAIQGLLASDIPRSESTTPEGDIVTFHIAVDPSAVPGGVFDLTVLKPAPVLVTPMLGGGSDAGGVYILLNNFDQQLVLGGASAAVGIALCAIPAVGWVGCGAITAALVVAFTWLSNYATCPGNLKVYVFPGPRIYGCVA